MSKTVLTYGTFDVFHVGHVRLLRRAAELGTSLIVGCSTDEFNLTKGKKSEIPYQYRKEILESCRYVSKVIPETCWEQKRRDVADLGVGVFVMGDDWRGKFDDLADLCEVVYLPRTENVSSSEIKENIKFGGPGSGDGTLYKSN